MNIFRITFSAIFIPLYLFSVKEKTFVAIINNNPENIVKMEAFFDSKEKSDKNFKLFFRLKEDGNFVAELKTLFGLTIYAQNMPNFKKGNHLFQVNIGKNKIKKGLYSFLIKDDENNTCMNRFIYIP